MPKFKKTSTSSLINLEASYIGSFIKDKVVREVDFYNNRSTIVEPSEFHDEILSAIMQAVNNCYAQNEKPTVSTLTDIILTDGILTVDSASLQGIIDAKTHLTSILAYCEEQGAVTKKQFRIKEIAFKEQWRDKKLSPESAVEVISRIHSGPGTSIEKAIKVRQWLDSLIGDTSIDSSTAYWDKQQLLFKEIPEKQRAMLGKPRFTFPSHWQVNRFIPTLKPGNKVVLSGGTGDGKSSLSMQFAEWASISKNVLVIHMEDSVETILMRQTCRWIGSTMDELERGDPLNKMAQMEKLREKWLDSGGSLTYKYLAGHSIPLIVEQIKDVARELEAEGRHLDLVVMDYFQKADHDSGVGEGKNYTNVANAGAEMLKILAQSLHLVMFVVSQETPDNFGGKHTAFSRALEQKPQIYISLTRQEIKKSEDIEYVYLDVGNERKKVSLAKVGDRSVWMQFHVKKVNDGRQGMQWLFFEGPRFRAFDPQFMMDVEANRINEFEVPLLQPFSQTDFERQNLYLEQYKQGYRTLQNPDDRRENLEDSH